VSSSFTTASNASFDRDSLVTDYVYSTSTENLPVTGRAGDLGGPAMRSLERLPDLLELPVILTNTREVWFRHSVRQYVPARAFGVVVVGVRRRPPRAHEPHAGH
jgi:hypothetical protein